MTEGAQVQQPHEKAKEFSELAQDQTESKKPPSQGNAGPGCRRERNSRRRDEDECGREVGGPRRRGDRVGGFRRLTGQDQPRLRFQPPRQQLLRERSEDQVLCMPSGAGLGMAGSNSSRPSASSARSRSIVCTAAAAASTPEMPSKGGVGEVDRAGPGGREEPANEFSERVTAPMTSLTTGARLPAILPRRPEATDQPITAWAVADALPVQGTMSFLPGPAPGPGVPEAGCSPDPDGTCKQGRRRRRPRLPR